MSGCVAYRVEPSENFAQTYQAVVATHYGVPALQKALAEFQSVVASYLSAFKNTARPSDSSAEPWPNRQPSTAQDGFECRKVRFRMPGLRGSATKGRLIYLVYESSCLIQPVWIYTHEEFDARPPDRDLRDALRDAIDRAAQYLEANPTVTLTASDGSKYEVEVRISDRRS